MANGKKTDQQRITATERRIKALALRKAGASYRAIADTLACSVATVYDDVQHAYQELNEQRQAEAAEAHTLENARLDDLQAAFWSRARSGDNKAAQTVLRIMERRAKMNGLDAPTQIAPVNADGTPYAAQYLEFRTVLLAALPTEQRLLVAEALEVLNSGQPADS